MRFFQELKWPTFVRKGGASQVLKCVREAPRSSRPNSLFGPFLLWKTQQLEEPVHKALYPTGAVQPTWSWVRFRVELEGVKSLSSLPPYFVMIEDLNLPWCHENMCVVFQTVKVESFDVWMRIPNHLRFRRSYLEQMSEKILGLLSQRIPGSKPEVVNMPQDYLYEAAELGAPRFPVYEETQLKNLKPTRFNNMVFDGPEYWQNLDWVGQLEYQAQVFEQLQPKTTQ